MKGDGGNMARLTKYDENGFPEFSKIDNRDLTSCLENEDVNNLFEAQKKLAEYEDLEECGRLLKLPAAIGDEIFCIYRDCPKDFTEKYCTDHPGGCENCSHRVAEILKRKFCPGDILILDEVFATQAEAEAALKVLDCGRH